MLDNLIKIETEYTKKFTLSKHTFAIGLPYIIHFITHSVVSCGYIFFETEIGTICEKSEFCAVA